MRIVLLGNKAAGAGNGLAAYRYLMRKFNALEHDATRLGAFDFVDITGDNLVDSLSRLSSLEIGSYDLLVVAGGDGTVTLALDAVADTDAALAIIPAGTGNDGARHFGITDWRRSADRLLNNLKAGHLNTVKTDLIKATFAADDSRQRWVLSVVTAGVDAAINQRANNYDWPRNRGRYVRAAVREFATLKGYHYELTLDGVKLPPQRLHLVAFANTSYYGGGMHIAPQASATDGQGTLVSVDPVARFTVLRVFPRIFSGTHVNHPAVHMTNATALTIDGPDLPLLYGDGEPLGRAPVTLEVISDALTLVDNWSNN